MNYQTVLQNYLPVEQGDFMLKSEIDDRGYAIYSPEKEMCIRDSEYGNQYQIHYVHKSCQIMSQVTNAVI